MKIIIDIPKKAYETIKTEKEIDWLGVEYILDCIKSGTPLPKNHGRLIDEKVIIENAVKGLNGIYDLTDMPDYIAGLSAIIPADKEEQK